MVNLNWSEIYNCEVCRDLMFFNHLWLVLLKSVLILNFWQAWHRCFECKLKVVRVLLPKLEYPLLSTTFASLRNTGRKFAQQSNFLVSERKIPIYFN